jgi:two-component system sensor histidine kinase KdpD
LPCQKAAPIPTSCCAALAEERSGVAGVVETHGRFETAALLGGLELLPRRRLSHRAPARSDLDR